MVLLSPSGSVALPFKNIQTFGGFWVVQLIKWLSVGFSSGSDLMSCGTEPHDGLYTGRGSGIYFKKLRIAKETLGGK